MTDLSAGTRRWTLTVLCLAVLLVMAGMTAPYPALAEVGADVGADQTQLTWIIDVYTLFLAGLLLPAGALGDRFGRRGVLVVGLAVFVGANLFSATIDTAGGLIIGRALAGVGAALILPSTLSLITGCFAAADRGRGVSLWAAFASFGALAALSLTGVLLEVGSWRSVFVASGVAGVVLFVASWTLPTSRDADRPRLDIPGTATSSAAIGAVVFGVIEAPERGWTSPVVLSTILVGAGLGAVFAVWELRTPTPLLDVRLLRDRVFGSSALVLVAQFFAAFGFSTVGFQYLQVVHGYSALESGFAFLPMGILLVPLLALSPWYVPRVGLKLVWVAGLSTLMAGLAVLSTSDVDSGVSVFVTSTVLLGAGIGLTAASSTSAIVDCVPSGKQGVAAAVNDVTREVGAALGIAIAGSLLAYGYEEDIRGPTAGLPDSAREAARDSVAGAGQAAAAHPGTGLGAAAREAFTAGVQLASWALFVGLALATVAIAVIAPGRVSPTAPRTAAASRDADTPASRPAAPG